MAITLEQLTAEVQRLVRVVEGDGGILTAIQQGKDE